MSAASKPSGKAMYVATGLDRDWLRIEQRKLYARSKENASYVFHKLWGLITDPRNLRVAFSRVAANRGKRTAGVDGITVRRVLAEGVDRFLEEVRSKLRAGTYRPSPVRRVFIPKPGQPGKFRPLGIPTVIDRIVQAAVKNILEPIFEADFFPSSYGFRPGKSVHGALEHLRMLLRPRHAGPEAERRLPYQWAIEGDIKGCFDNIDHHGLMVRIRRRVLDVKANRLVLAFLKAGVLSEEQFLRSDSGTPQGGILSPLLSNIALSAIDERYERHAGHRSTCPRAKAAPARKRADYARRNDRRLGRKVLFPVRYADDFIILVNAPLGPDQWERARELANQEKADLAAVLKEQLGLELSEEKTLVTPVTRRLRFLGHHVCVREHPTSGRLVSTTLIPKDRSHRFREKVKDLFRSKTQNRTLIDRLQKLNPMLRGWCFFYRHAWGAKHVFSALDSYVWWTILRWLRKKHDRTPMKVLAARYGWKKPGGRALRWRDGNVTVFEASRVPVRQFKLGWQKGPHFASTSMESPVHIERCTPGSGEGAGETSAG